MLLGLFSVIVHGFSACSHFFSIAIFGQTSIQLPPPPCPSFIQYTFPNAFIHHKQFFSLKIRLFSRRSHLSIQYHLVSFSLSHVRISYISVLLYPVFHNPSRFPLESKIKAKFSCCNHYYYHRRAPIKPVRYRCRMMNMMSCVRFDHVRMCVHQVSVYRRMIA